MTDTKKQLLDFTLEELKDELIKLGQKPFVAKQIFDWVYKKSVISFADMTNLSLGARTVLEENFDVLPFPSFHSITGSSDAAEKYLFKLSGGLTVEAVVLQEKKYKTLCISSQCGCPVDCKFCLTGVAGFKKNLTTAEILGQLLAIQSEGHGISRMVFMGMGEPLMNFKPLIKALERINAEDGFYISQRKITVSTSGYIAGIKQLMETGLPINLAFSVGHPDPIQREKIMPIEKRNPIVEVARLLKSYQKQNNRKLTLEYTLLQGINDDNQANLELAHLALYLNAKVNLINLNPHPKIPFKPVLDKVMNQFKRNLHQLGVTATVRYEKGQEITAACGQLGESIVDS